MDLNVLIFLLVLLVVLGAALITRFIVPMWEDHKANDVGKFCRVRGFDRFLTSARAFIFTLENSVKIRYERTWDLFCEKIHCPTQELGFGFKFASSEILSFCFGFRFGFLKSDLIRESFMVI